MRMTWLLIAAIVVAILLGGCAWLSGAMGPREGQYTYTNKTTYLGPPARQIPIWVDKNFGAADKIAIDDAVNAWNYALNGFIVLKVVDTEFDMEIPKIVDQVKSNGWLFMRIDSSNPMVPILKDGFRTIGFCEVVGGHHLYLVRDRMFNSDVFGVTMHEMGHLLGAEHKGDKLMYPHFTRARFQCVDLVTIQQVADYNHIPADRLNFCVDTDGINPVTDSKDGAVDPITCPN
jgi:Matrixin